MTKNLVELEGFETPDLLLTIGIRSTSWPGISPEGQIRGPASAQLGQVQEGSRQMRPPRFLPTGHRGGARVRPGFAWPDLCSIGTANEQDEFARAVCGGFSADSCQLADDHPPAPLTSGIDRAIRLSTAAAVLAAAAIAGSTAARAPASPPLPEVDDLDQPGAELIRGGAEVPGEPESDGTWTWLTLPGADGTIHSPGARTA
jgi:hypothetical protein